MYSSSVQPYNLAKHGMCATSLENQNDKVVKRRSECRLYKLTGGQTDRQTDRQADTRQADRQRHVLRGCASKKNEFYNSGNSCLRIVLVNQVPL